MTVYGFKQKKVAERLSDFAKRNLKPDTGRPVLLPAKGRQFLCETPTDGIPSASGDYSYDSAECTVYVVDETTSKIIPLTDSNGSNVMLKVYNPWSGSIAGSTLITAKMVGTFAIVDAEDCPPSDPPLEWGGAIE